MQSTSGGDSIHEVILTLEKQLTHLRIENWLNQDIFSWQWWLLVTVLLVPWFIWWKYIDKKRLLEVMLFGTYILIISSYLDAVITELGWWEYKVWVIPLWPRLIPADFTVLPVTYMAVYQKYQSWKSYIAAMLIVSGVYSFIAEPLLEWANIYKQIDWKHIYSFPVYIIMGVFVKWLIKKLTLAQKI